MTLRRVTIEVPVFEGYDLPIVRQPTRNCSDYILNLPGTGVTEANDHTVIAAMGVQLVYRPIPAPKPEVVCQRCGFDRSTLGEWHERDGSIPCPVCGSRLWDFPDKRGA